MNFTQFRRSGHFPTLLCAFLYFDVSFMTWTLLGALGVFVAQQLHLTPGQKGLIVAIPLLGGAVFRIILGIATDRFGARRAALTGLALTVIPLLWGWRHAESVQDLVGIGLLLGIAGASFAAALPLASRWYPPQFQGLAMGIAGAGNSGTVLAALFAPRLAEHFGWHAVLGLAIIPISVTLLLFALFAREAPVRPAPMALGSYLRILRETDMWRFNLLYSVTFGGFVGMASFLSIFFFDQYGVSRVVAGNFTALCVFAGSLLRPIGGALADRFGGIKVLSYLFAAIIGLMMLLSLSPALPIAIVLLFVIMACLGTGNGSVFQLVPLRFRDEIGVATGIVGAAGGVGGFFLPTLLGYFKGVTGSYASGFVIFAAFALLAELALIYAQHEWRRGWARTELDVAA